MLRFEIAVQADVQLLAFLAQIDKLAVVKLAEIVVKGSKQKLLAFQEQLAQRMTDAVSVTVLSWSRNKSRDW